MVTADIAQLATECNTWREALRSSREEFTQHKTSLQQLASSPLSKDQLTAVEHFHNQFHLQLINIHDLKQAIKNHDRKVQLEQVNNAGQLNEETAAEHEDLHEDFQALNGTLNDLRTEFSEFMNRTK
jgi:hypothetical protein